MNILFLALAMVLQVVALRLAAEAWEEYGVGRRDKRRRNRLAFGTLVFSVAAMLTAAAA